MGQIRLFNNDCLTAMMELPDNSVDSIVTDPPYGLSFLNKKWDYDVPSTEIWEECLRVLKPGGHLLSFSGSRTYHRMALRIEDAGFEIRDQIMWIYSSGFPKSYNIGKAIDKLQGNERDVVGEKVRGDIEKAKENCVGYLADPANRNNTKSFGYGTHTITKGNSQYEGWGTALKPAHEPIVMARKPFKGSVAENVLKYGTGGINIDESRIGNEVELEGRWPANIIFDEEAGKILDEQSSEASRFFYCPKASKKDRDEGMDAFEDRPSQLNSGGIGRKISLEKRYEANGENAPTVKNNHPTVKPTKLMEYLIKLITPKNGIVLDPFMGSGSTGKAAIKNNFGFIGIEREKEYFEIAKARIEYENTLNYPIEINQDEL